MIVRTIQLMFLLVFVGCASTGSILIEDLVVPLNELQKIAEDNLPIKKISQSRNGREIYSDYFVTTNGDFEEAEGTVIRNQAVITILGDRRPYSVEVRVAVYKRDRSNQFQLIGHDEGIARVISRRIQQALYKRREDRNVVDDFRVF